MEINTQKELEQALVNLRNKLAEAQVMLGVLEVFSAMHIKTLSENLNKENTDGNRSITR